MTTPNLSISIPVVQQAKGTTKYIIDSHGELIPEHEEKEVDSDASSVCQSPGWDDISGKKRKKEKKEKEREKKRLEKEKLMAESARLQKKIPKKLSKVPAAMDRTVSAPVVPVVPTVQVPTTVIVPKVMVPVEMAQKGGRARRGSMDLGLRSLLHAKKAISTPWRSSAAPVTPAAEMPPMPRVDSGFIGGLKLRQSMEVSTQEEMARLKKAMEQDETFSKERPAETKLASSRTSFAESTMPVSIYEEPSRTNSQWDTIYTQAALIASTGEETIADDDTLMIERNARKGRKSHPPTSRYFENGASNSRRDLSTSSSRVSFPSDGPESMVSSPSSMPIEHSRHNSTSSYSHSRQQSQDQLVSDAENNYTVGGVAGTRKSESRGRSIFNRSKSPNQNPSEGRPGTAESGGRDGAINPILREDPVSPSHPAPIVKSPVDTAFKNHRNSSFAASGVKGLRNAARAAFFKNSISTHSGSDIHSSAELLTAKPRPQSGKRPSTTDNAILKRSPTKAERILGEQIPPELSPRLPSFKHVSQLRQDHGPSGSSSASSQINWAHSRSSSDEYSTPDEYSNITTPTGSRPQSQKGYFPKMDDSASRSKMSMSTGNIHQPKSAYLMSGAIPSDENLHSEREDCSGSAMPMELTDEERGGTPTPETSTVPHLDEGGLGRQQSLSRSISNPELHDLSFLPKLKHQALAPRPPEKSKKRVPKSTRMDKMPQHTASSLSEPLTIPGPLSPLPLPSFPHNGKTKSKSEHSSPTSPLSSQYLKNARLSLPKKAGSANGAPEPLAKMFVVCCSCKYFHDMPSKIYACMAQPDNVVRDTARGVQGVVSTAVKCPWCGHGMSTKCCEGYAAVVYLRERLH